MEVLTGKLVDVESGGGLERDCEVSGLIKKSCYTSRLRCSKRRLVALGCGGWVGWIGLPVDLIKTTKFDRSF